MIGTKATGMKRQGQRRTTCSLLGVPIFPVSLFGDRLVFFGGPVGTKNGTLNASALRLARAVPQAHFVLI